MQALRTTHILFAVALAGCSGGVSQFDKQAVAAAVSCRDISDDADRLACLDNASATLAKTNIVRENAEGVRTPYIVAQSAPAPEDAAAEKTPGAAPPEEDFGGERLKAREALRENRKPPMLTAQIVEIVVNPYNKMTVTLDNGQVWRQLDGDDQVVRFLGEPQVYTAEIKRSLLGNYPMKIVERNRTIRVRRIQ